ncbi:hypothetical protein MMC07_000379 [Pseudocyphellaria aurata]|nr:hypothetical protein [Pseudocyphellaria aurata]
MQLDARQGSLYTVHLACSSLQAPAYSQGRTALMHAAAAGSPACVQLLLAEASRRQQTLGIDGDKSPANAWPLAISILDALHTIKVRCEGVHGTWLKQPCASRQDPFRIHVCARDYWLLLHVQIGVICAGALAAAIEQENFKRLSGSDEQDEHACAACWDRLRCIALLVKARCGMTAAQCALVTDMLEGSPPPTVMHEVSQLLHAKLTAVPAPAARQGTGPGHCMHADAC